jgi:cell division transport system permease protein
LFHLINTTINNIKSNRQLFSMSVATISIAFSVLGLFFLLFVNLNSLLSTWDKHVQLIVFLDNDISKDSKNKLEQKFKLNEKIKSFIFVSRSQAWESFKNTFSMKSSFIKSIDSNPLPASYELKFIDGSERLVSIREFNEVLKIMDGVESLEYGEKWISRFEKFIIFFRIFIISFGLILFSGMILIVSNTIKISIYTRKEELDLMLLLGARNQFIKAPLVMEGVLHGIVGVLIGLIVVKLVHVYLGFQFQGALSSIFRGIEFQYLSNNLILAMFSAGIFIGMFGSILPVNQFLCKRFRE